MKICYSKGCLSGLDTESGKISPIEPRNASLWKVSRDLLSIRISLKHWISHLKSQELFKEPGRLS